MPFSIIRADITKLKVDAIVNAANETLLGGGGVDGAIHRAAGPALLAECRTLGGCKTGEAKITRGYLLPASYVIHTVGPIWRGGAFGEDALLAAAYRNSLLLAEKTGCETIAFPLISAGAYGFPKDRALQIAVETIRAFLQTHEMTVTLTVFDKDSFQLSKARFDAIESYIDQTYVDSCPDERVSRPFVYHAERKALKRALFPTKREERQPGATAPAAAAEETEASEPLEALLSNLDAGFSETLLRMIDERGIKDSDCYKKANIDRKLFSKIRSNPQYRPSKPTALAFAVALELSLAQTNELLRRAGFALSHASKFDVIVEYFIRNQNYNIFEINEALFAFDQVLLGG